jgi:hypothetical protein
MAANALHMRRRGIDPHCGQHAATAFAAGASKRASPERKTRAMRVKGYAAQGIATDQDVWPRLNLNCQSRQMRNSDFLNIVDMDGQYVHLLAAGAAHPLGKEAGCAHREHSRISSVLTRHRNLLCCATCQREPDFVSLSGNLNCISAFGASQ